MMRTAPRTRSLALIALIAAQAICAAIFLTDISGDLMAWPNGDASAWHLGVELFANLGLVAAMVFEAAILVRMLRRQAHDARALSIASGALHDVIEGWFREWGLTASEADVAMFTIKGSSIAEIAVLRGSAEATVKSHLNAIYRKAGVAGRPQLLSLLIEDLLGRRLMGADAAGEARESESGPEDANPYSSRRCDRVGG